MGLNQAELYAQNATIIIVDDSELSRQMLTQILRRHGYKNIVTAEDGLNALEKLKECHADLIILDLIMPRMNGFDFCVAVKAMPEYAQTPIIVQTAHENEVDIDRLFDMGVADLIIKPINPVLLATKLQQQLEVYYTLKNKAQPSV